jgi:hypothetical protein
MKRPPLKETTERLHRQMVDILQREHSAMVLEDRVDPLAVLAAVLLTLKSVEGTMPPADHRPPDLQELLVMSQHCLEMINKVGEKRSD